jgi:hypothetical protein
MSSFKLAKNVNVPPNTKKNTKNDPKLFSIRQKCPYKVRKKNPKLKKKKKKKF